MSCLEFDGEAHQYRVKLPPVRKLPPNPLIGPAEDAWARALALPSDTSQTDSELPPEFRSDKTIRQLLLASDQRSFLTGSAVADLRAARLINTVRNNSTRKMDVVSCLWSSLCNNQHRISGSLPFAAGSPRRQ
jgi:hypothetical protein